MISQIFEGWRNHLAPKEYMKEKIKEVSDKRLTKCRNCPLHSSNKKNYSTFRVDEHCTECGCTLAAKTKCLSCNCPINEWGPELTYEQEKIIKDETDI